MVAVGAAVAQWLGAQVVDEQAAGAEAPHFRAPVHQCVPMRLPLPRGDPGQGTPPGKVFLDLALGWYFAAGYFGFGL